MNIPTTMLCPNFFVLNFNINIGSMFILLSFHALGPMIHRNGIPHVTNKLSIKLIFRYVLWSFFLVIVLVLISNVGLVAVSIGNGSVETNNDVNRHR
jgi:hypothetical protein